MHLPRFPSCRDNLSVCQLQCHTKVIVQCRGQKTAVVTKVNSDGSMCLVMLHFNRFRYGKISLIRKKVHKISRKIFFFAKKCSIMELLGKK